MKLILFPTLIIRRFIVHASDPTFPRYVAIVAFHQTRSSQLRREAKSWTTHQIFHMDDPLEVDAPVVEQPSKKRSLFSKKAIEKAAEPQEAVELFRRAKEVHPQILAEEERRRQKKFTKLERKRSSTSADTKEITPPEEKRRRVAAQAKPKDDYSSDESRSPHTEPSFRARRY